MIFISNKERHYKLWSIFQEGIGILNEHAPNKRALKYMMEKLIEPKRKQTNLQLELKTSIILSQ